MPALSRAVGICLDRIRRVLLLVRRQRDVRLLVWSLRRAVSLTWRFYSWSLSPKDTYLLWWKHLVGLCAVYGVYRSAELLARLVETAWSRFWFWFRIRQGSEHHQRVQVLRIQQDQASSYAQWRETALELDQLAGLHQWKTSNEDDHLLNAERLAQNTELIQQHIDAGEVRGLMRLLRSRLQRNFANMTNEALYRKLQVGTKASVEHYIRTVRRALKLLARHSEVTLREKLVFFKETRHAFGRTALLLSGGGQLGLFHIGVVRALVEADLLPQVICGSSVGAVFASLIASRSDEDLIALGDPGTIDFDFFPKNRGNILRRLRRIMQSGFLMDIEVLIRCLRDNIGDLTFQEAYDRFGRICNISVTPSDNSEPLLLNFLTAPNVLLWSASAASCAIPLVYKSVQLLAKDEYGQIVPWLSPGVSFVDGSVKSDLPMERLRELFNINHFVVSQVNPHVAPFLFQTPQYPLLAAFQRFVTHFGRYVLHSLILFLSLLSPLRGDVGVGRMAQIFESMSSQVYTADITLVPPLRLVDYTQLMQNPTEARLRSCVETARRYTWRQVSRVFAHCEIEFELDNWVAELRREAVRRSSPTAANALLTTSSLGTAAAIDGVGSVSPAQTIAGSSTTAGHGGSGSSSGMVSPLPVILERAAPTSPQTAPADSPQHQQQQHQQDQSPLQRKKKGALARNSESLRRLRAYNRVRSWSTWDLDEDGDPILQSSSSQPSLLDADMG